MATSSEQAPAEEMRDGGAHLDRKLLFASCELNVEKQCVFPHSLSTTCMLSTQDASVFPHRPTAVHSRNDLDQGWPNWLAHLVLALAEK